MEKKYSVIYIDEQPEPWEDFGYCAYVVLGTQEQIDKHVETVRNKNPKWLVTERKLYTINNSVGEE